MTKFSIYIALFQSTQEPGNKPRFSTVCWSPQGALNYKGKLSVGQSPNLLSVVATGSKGLTLQRLQPQANTIK